MRILPFIFIHILLLPSLLTAGGDTTHIDHDDTLDPVPHWAYTEWNDEAAGAVRMQGWELIEYSAGNELDSVGSIVRSYIPAYALYYAARGTRSLTMRMLGWQRVLRRHEFKVDSQQIIARSDSIAEVIVWMRYDDSAGMQRWALLEVTMAAHHNGAREWEVPDLVGRRELPYRDYVLTYDTVKLDTIITRIVIDRSTFRTGSRRSLRRKKSTVRDSLVIYGSTKISEISSFIDSLEADVLRMDTVIYASVIIPRYPVTMRTFDHPPTGADITRFIMDAKRPPEAADTIIRDSALPLQPDREDVIIESTIRERTWYAVTGEPAPMFFPSEE